MNLIDVIRLSRLFKSISIDPVTASPFHDITEEKNCHAMDGVIYDTYAPIKKANGAIIALHGITVQGKSDRRLVHFARCVAHSGIDCIVPTLPGLGSCKFDPRDIGILQQIIAEVSGRSGRKIGLIGFSFGASYAIVAASRPETSKHVQFIISFGAYYSLAQFYNEWIRGRHRTPQNDIEWDNYIYFYLAAAYSRPRGFTIDDSSHRDIGSLLERYCNEATIEEKKKIFIEKHLPEDLIDVSCRSLEPNTFDDLSPAGKLSGIGAPISLIHDINDGVIPPEHSSRIFDELSRDRSGMPHHILRTSLLSHVSLSDVLKIGELFRLYQGMAMMFGSYGQIAQE